MTWAELQKTHPELCEAIRQQFIAEGAARERERFRAILNHGRRPEVRSAAEFLASKTNCTPGEAREALSYAQRSVIQTIQRNKP